MAEKPPSTPSRTIIWYVLGMLVLLLIVQYYSVAKQSVEISYSEFRHLVETKGVEDLAISTDTITGNLLP